MHCAPHPPVSFTPNPITQIAALLFNSYLQAKFPVVGEHEAMLARIQGIAAVVRQHPEVTDDAARAIDQVLQRLLAQPRAVAGANDDDIDDDDDA